MEASLNSYCSGCVHVRFVGIDLYKKCSAGETGLSMTDLSVQPGFELTHTDVGAGFGCSSSVACSEPHIIMLLLHLFVP